MASDWNVYNESRQVTGETRSWTDFYPDEEAARETFGARRHDVKYAESSIRWLVQLRHGDQVVDEARSPE